MRSNHLTETIWTVDASLVPELPLENGPGPSESATLHAADDGAKLVGENSYRRPRGVGAECHSASSKTIVRFQRYNAVIEIPQYVSRGALRVLEAEGCASARGELIAKRRQSLMGEILSIEMRVSDEIARECLAHMEIYQIEGELGGEPNSTSNDRK